MMDQDDLCWMLTVLGLLLRKSRIQLHIEEIRLGDWSFYSIYGGTIWLVCILMRIQCCQDGGLNVHHDQLLEDLTVTGVSATGQ